MNHCTLEVEVIEVPKLRYTQDNKTPIAEMEVRFPGLRLDDKPSQLKVIGWGNLAQEMPNQIEAGQKLVIEGRLRMNTIPRQDGTKEKRAEFTLSKFHSLTDKSPANPNYPSSEILGSDSKPTNPVSQNEEKKDEEVSWNSSPLIPDTDEIPF